MAALITAMPFAGEDAGTSLRQPGGHVAGTPAAETLRAQPLIGGASSSSTSPAPTALSFATTKVPISSHTPPVTPPTQTRAPAPSQPPSPRPSPRPPGFDLVVTSVGIEGPPRAGRTVRFEATIRNAGADPTPAGVIHGVRFELDGQFVAWADLHVTSLAPGASVTLRSNGAPEGGAPTWSTAVGRHTVTAWVDDVNRMPEESDENNNRLSETIKIK